MATFDIDYLKKLIANGVEEDSELEYKAAAALQRDDKKITEATKDVSAFANSNGGILIYGISEDRTNRHLPGNIDPVDRKAITKEWLEQILNARIRPRIHGIKIHVVTIADDKVVYILKIPKGETAHQANDKLYYRRHNFSVESMFDSEIRDVMARQKAPQIKVHFDVTKKPNILIAPNDRPMLHQQRPMLFSLNVYIENVGKMYATYINIVLTLPERIIDLMCDEGDKRTIQISLDNKVRDEIEIQDANRPMFFAIEHTDKPKQYGPPRNEPLLPGMQMPLKSFPVYIENIADGDVLSWTLHADNAEPQTGTLEFGQVAII
ncbi:AlbA family DNA-binding domain-containing protein [Mucilaginibacter flavidus]|uniref:AlbA family DNA-binding domain-containing protein n=1 Tax=Mucilaginibacter flavidus TaxID=2949309 RepID=UPI002093DA5A|nr:ATP-binding protein [Mucilaginibacter flavidus]MCO5948313.1 ATP-binding protein [Mucilaginibacter flavidus]